LKLLSPSNWSDYELIDCGDFEKLERFGKYHLIRPEPQAVWKKKLSENEWLKIADARFKREKQKISYRSGDAENGGWTLLKKMPENWTITYNLASHLLTFKLALTSFGHIGIFPEQAENWNYIFNTINEIKNSENIQDFKFLNLFAYTGGASLAAKTTNIDVTHLDAVKQVVNWSSENMTLSNLKDIRWVVEDATKFLKREVKRQKKYNAIILDPPAYGRGPEGEKWILEDGINEILELSAQLLEKENSFLILNLYSLGFSSLIAKNLIETYFKTNNLEFGEFYLKAKSKIELPLGTFVRFKNILN